MTRVINNERMTYLQTIIRLGGLFRGGPIDGLYFTNNNVTGIPQGVAVVEYKNGKLVRFLGFEVKNSTVDSCVFSFKKP